MGVELVWLDVAKQSCAGICDSAKVSSKDRPTLFLRANDSLHKVGGSLLNEDFLITLKKEVERIQSNRLIWSARDLTEALRKNNTELDSLTVVYAYD